VIGVPDHRGGPWFTGYTSHGGDWFIFSNIGTAGRTGHDYENRFVNKTLIWYGKNGSRLNQPSIRRLLSPRGHVYIFYREEDRSPFTFAGLGSPVRTRDISPVEVEWSFRDTLSPTVEILPEEIPNPETVFEGARKTVTINVYERDASARRTCLEHWGTTCIACGFDFKRMYGALGAGFIHVHHLKPVAEIGEQYELDPINDLRPVCPNCHAMLHKASPVLSIAQLKTVIDGVMQP
jgi:5-methylcytosine-specific restriction protein A